MPRSRRSRRARAPDPLPGALVGNGSVLLTVSPSGGLQRLWWPHVDHGQHLGDLRLGVVRRRRTRWLDDATPTEQSYEPDTTLLTTRVQIAGRRVSVTDLVVPDRPVLVRHLTGPRRARAVVYVRPTFDGHPDGGGAYVDPTTSALVLYRRDRAMAVHVVGAAASACGQRNRPGTDVFGHARRGRIEGDTVGHGHVDAAQAAPVGDGVTVVVAMGTSPRDALAHLAAVVDVDWDELVRQRRDRDRGRLAGAPAPQLPAGLPADLADRATELYRRSLLVFDLLADQETGGVIAAPELDPDFVVSGGYGYVWGRDLAFIVLALLASRRDDLARRALGWLVRTQEPEGWWLQRHTTEGHLGASWGHQIDETGAVLHAYGTALHVLDDPDLASELWPSARAAADLLADTVDPDRGLPVPTMDLWEERAGEHAYTAASVVAGLRSAAGFAESRDPDAARRWRIAADRVRTAIDRQLWRDGRYVRSARVLRPDRAGDRLPDLPEPLPFPLGRATSCDDHDATPDASVFGLAWPFRAVAPGQDRMRATAAELATRLRAGGGLLRYADDTYAGGNPWVLTTLWHGLWCRQVDDEQGLADAVAWTVERATPTGLLAEQVSERDGRPVWVLPLTWSHAMLVLALRPELPQPWSDASPHGAQGV